MSVYVDDDFVQLPQATITVHEETRSARVTYPNRHGQEFRVIVRQKPNPIGFTARLPGDRKK